MTIGPLDISLPKIIFAKNNIAMTVKHYCYLFLLILMAGACSSDDDSSDQGNPSFSALRLKQLVVAYEGTGEVDTRNYIYDANGKLKSIQGSSTDGSSFTQNFNYQNDKLSSIVSTTGTQTNFEYTDGRISSATYAHDPERTTFFYYNDDGKLVIEEEFRMGEFTSFVSYEYNSSGNVTTEVIDFGSFQNSIDYTSYDTQKQVTIDSYPEELYALWARSTNNWTTRTSATSGEEDTVNYQYNELGYPVSAELFLAGLLDRTITYTYEEGL